MAAAHLKPLIWPGSLTAPHTARGACSAPSPPWQDPSSDWEHDLHAGGNPALPGAVVSKGSSPKEEALQKCHCAFTRECALSWGRKIYWS